MKVQIISPVSKKVTMEGSSTVPRKSCYNLRPSELLKKRLSPNSMTKVCQSSTPTPRKSSRMRRKTVQGFQHRSIEPSVINFDESQTEAPSLSQSTSPAPMAITPEVGPQNDAENLQSTEKEKVMERKSDCLLEENRKRTTKERASFERPQSERFVSKKPRISLRKLKHAEATEELNMETTFNNSMEANTSGHNMEETLESTVHGSVAETSTHDGTFNKSPNSETPAPVPFSDTPTLNTETISPSSEKSSSIEPRNLQDDFIATNEESPTPAAAAAATRVPRIELSNVQIFALADGLFTPLHITKENAQFLYNSGINRNVSSTSSENAADDSYEVENAQPNNFTTAPLTSSINFQERIQEAEKEEQDNKLKKVSTVPNPAAKVSKARDCKSIIKRNILAMKSSNSKNNGGSTKKVAWSLIENRNSSTTLKGYMKPTLSSRAKASNKDFLKPEPQDKNKSLTPKKKGVTLTPRSCKTKFYGRKTIAGSKK